MKYLNKCDVMPNYDDVMKVSAQCFKHMRRRWLVREHAREREGAREQESTQEREKERERER